MIKIKEHRIKNGLLQIELAKKIGVHRTTVNKWETGVNKPNIEKLLKLCEIFNCEIKDLIKK